MDEEEYKSQLALLRAGVDASAPLSPAMILILQDLAASGVPVYPWELLVPLLAKRMSETIDHFVEKDACASNASDAASGSSEDAEQRSRAGGVRWAGERKAGLIELLYDFASPPFTIQRIAELLLYPQKHFSTCAKFMNALERVLTVSSTICTVPFSTRPRIDRSTHPIYNDTLHTYKKNASIRPSGGANSVSRISSASSPGRQSPVAPWTDAMAHTTDDSADAASFRFENLQAGLSNDISSSSSALLNALIPRRSRSSEITVPPPQASLYNRQAGDGSGAQPQPGSPSHPAYALPDAVPDVFPVVDRIALGGMDQHAWIDVTSSMERSDAAEHEGLRCSPRSPQPADPSSDAMGCVHATASLCTHSRDQEVVVETAGHARRATAGVGALLHLLRQGPDDSTAPLAAIPLRRPRERPDDEQASSPTKKLRGLGGEPTAEVPSPSAKTIGRSSPSALALLQDYDEGEQDIDMSSVGVT